MDEKKLKALLGKRIRQLRREQGLTQDAVSERAGTITEKRWSDIERGMYSVGLITLSKIASGLNVSLHELFKFEDGKPERRVKTDSLKRKISNLEKQAIKTSKQVDILKRGFRDLRKSLE